ncbi:MAG: hypothetical protein GWN71_03420 [Gammaproteobacteria bacterium]|nr:hypothetical protein [Gemmatimonadota bacterium]NIU72656.1 hypothetical protein [Gammaproteobacteria bacterium]
MRGLIRVAIACVALAACSDAPRDDAPARAVDARQRDSAIGASGLPGAKGVTRALEASDAVKERAATLDSVLR